MDFSLSLFCFSTFTCFIHFYCSLSHFYFSICRSTTFTFQLPLLFHCQLFTFSFYFSSSSLFTFYFLLSLHFYCLIPLLHHLTLLVLLLSHLTFTSSFHHNIIIIHHHCNIPHYHCQYYIFAMPPNYCQYQCYHICITLSPSPHHTTNTLNVIILVILVVVVILFWQFQSVHCTPKFFRRISAPCSTGRPLIGWSKDIWGEMDGANNLWTIIISCFISIQCWIWSYYHAI